MLRKLNKKVDQLFSVLNARIKIKDYLLCLFFLFFSFGSLANEFVYGLGDIPIFKNMKNEEDSFILFDKVEGRFAYSEISGEYTVKETEKFYNTVLPNLGWEKKKKNLFKRGNENLEIKYFIKENKTKVIFSIFPKKN